ncbi:MAG: phosphate/phosphite/phosphonate ABC transporter substrate-binding protein [Candidatus Methylomirabilales bacterium]
MGASQWRRRVCAFATAVVGLLALTGCGQDNPYPQVTLKNKVALAGVRQTAGQSLVQPHRESPLRVAIASILSPAKNLESYHGLLAYLERRLGRPVRLVQRMTYAEVNDLMKTGQIDMAFVCTLAYIEGQQEFGMELLVAPQIRDQTVYYSYLIVPKGSPVRSLTDLKGKAFAFSDPLSNSGRLAPTFQLFRMGTTPDAFFGRTVFTYSHDNSVVAVADRLVDGAAVDSLVYDFLAKTEPDLTDKTRIVARWGPYGIPPVVVPSSLDPSLKERLRQVFLNMHRDVEGRGIINDLFIDRFVLVQDDVYDSVRLMAAKVR